MQKIRLDPEALRVDSFQTGAGAKEHGTVHGQSTTIYFPCQTISGPVACFCPATRSGCTV